MLLSISIQEKSVGADKVLFKDGSFTVHEGAKIGIIGRNGMGKTTLFRMLTGKDTDFSGELELKKGARLLLTEQEHHSVANLTPLEYVMQEIPSYYSLKEKIEEFSRNESPTSEDIHRFTHAEQEFTAKRYWNIEEQIITSLDHYGVGVDAAFAPITQLSGGEKRFVELVRMQYAEADLVLLDEPTNHMDYIGKAEFIEWLKDTSLSVVLISHDRDVLEAVNEIYELKDRQLKRFPGNYSAYLQQNGTSTISQVTQYENTLKRLDNLHDQWMLARARKNAAKSDAGRNNAKTQETRLEKEYLALKESLAKPSFWIDKQTLAVTQPKLAERYHKYKDRTIHINTNASDEPDRELIRISGLSLGYDEPLFSNLSFTITQGNRVEIKGRNGAGKSTLLRSLLAEIKKEEASAWAFGGSIWHNDRVRVGVYEQEIGLKTLPMLLGEALVDLYWVHGRSLSEQHLRSLLASYLFDPIHDANLRIEQLSGGQKARFQLIKMLVNDPNLLILDEPTNHLDLPSIEELERALLNYTGAILYVSHDSYFTRALGGEVIGI